MSPLEDEVRADQAKSEGKDPRLAEIERLAAELHGSGVDFRVEYGQIIQAKHDRDKDRETALSFDTNHLRLGIVSDTHGGSKFEQLTALRDFYKRADDAESGATSPAATIGTTRSAPKCRALGTRTASRSIEPPGASAAPG